MECGYLLDGQQTASLRYSRLEACATINASPALRTFKRKRPLCRRFAFSGPVTGHDPFAQHLVGRLHRVRVDHKLSLARILGN